MRSTGRTRTRSRTSNSTSDGTEVSDKDDMVILVPQTIVKVRKRRLHVTGTMTLETAEMSAGKKKIRESFRSSVFERDQHMCVMCGVKETELAEDSKKLDAHHIVDRNEMPHGGYVKENGISLCPTCHELAEVFHSTGTSHPGFSPDDLFGKIGSNLEKARRAAERLG